MEDFELTLFDRIEAIKSANKKYDIENNAYLSFSGGKDSTMLHYLIDMALPNNNIPRVYVNTGIEYIYIYIYKFVEELAKNDKRIEIIKPSVPIKKMLEEKGYPFKSKEHSLRVEQFNKGTNANFIKKYTRQTNYEGAFVCPKSLMYQFEERGKYNYSNKCCYEMKKKPMHKYEMESKRKITMTGMRRQEGGNRRKLTCIITNSKKKVTRFHPLVPVSNEFVEWFINKYSIKLAPLYYPPYNFKRTGCKGCPYALEIKEELRTLEKYLPNERKQCEIIWKPVYDEYRRINYRLDRDEQLELDLDE